MFYNVHGIMAILHRFSNTLIGDNVRDPIIYLESITIVFSFNLLINPIPLLNTGY